MTIVTRLLFNNLQTYTYLRREIIFQSHKGVVKFLAHPPQNWILPPMPSIISVVALNAMVIPPDYSERCEFVPLDVCFPC